MTKKTMLWGFALAAAVALPFSSCTKDSSKDEPTPDPSNKVEYNPSTMTEKDYLEETATSFLGYFDANDQKTLLRLASFYIDEYEDYSWPDEFGMADNERTRALMSSLIHGDYNELTSSFYVYTYNMARFRGVYEPNLRYKTWTRVKQSDDFVMHFTDDFRVDCTLTVTGSKDCWTYSQMRDNVEVNVEMPKSVVLTLVRGEETLVTATVSSEFKNGSVLKATVNADLMNINVKMTVDGDNREVKSNAALSISGTCIATADASIKGNDLCNINVWENIFYQYGQTEGLSRLVDSASANLSILGQVNLSAEVKNIYNFLEYLDFWADSYDNENPEALAKEAARRLKSAVDGKMYFHGQSKPVATLGWEAYMDYSYGDYYTEWGVRPVFTFTSDNSTYDFESYFGDHKFYKVEALWQQIVNSYSIYFK